MGISICRLSLLIHCGPYSAISLPRSRWHCEGKTTARLQSWYPCVCLYECVRAGICLHVHELFGSEVIHDGAALSPQSVVTLPPLSFYRKLIGSCHWCVKLLCVGHCRQLDYLFFILSILEQLPCALLLFLNEISFLSVALAATVRNCFKS